MGEQATKTGKKLEVFAKEFLTKLGWNELISNKEITCIRPATHKKKTHGIDSLYKYDTPYYTYKSGILVECKNRKMASINKTSLQEWVEEAIKNIECIQQSSELVDIDIDNTIFKTGLLLINANDCFDESKFYEAVNELYVPARRNPINIFIAGTDRINQWYATRNFISKQSNFVFIYPCINSMSMVKTEVFSLNYMYSKYFFAESEYESNDVIRGVKQIVKAKQSIMFFYDEINRDNFEYAWSMFKFYQRQSCDRYLFVFYPKTSKEADFVKEFFVSTVKSIEGDNNESNKIEIAFLDNREIQVIDIEGENI